MIVSVLNKHMTAAVCVHEVLASDLFLNQNMVNMINLHMIIVSMLNEHMYAVVLATDLFLNQNMVCYKAC